MPEPEIPRSSSITTTCSRVNPSSIARSTSAYCRAVDSTLRSTCACEDWRRYTNAWRRRCEEVSFERSLTDRRLLLVGLADDRPRDQRRQQRHRRLPLLLADQLPQRHRGRRALRQLQTQLHDRLLDPDHRARPGRHARAPAPGFVARRSDRQAKPASPPRQARAWPAGRSMRPGPSGGCRPAAPGSAPADLRRRIHPINSSERPSHA